CVVEVKGLNKLVPSCSTPVNDGMDIITKNDKIINSRKTALELLLSNHYADCIGPCINNCPANVDAQGYIALISIGKYKEALKLIKESNPLPLSIGRVCVRNCEDNCRRCLLDDPVSVNSLKRFVADKEGTYWKPEIKEKKKNKIAIIGGGPAGLTCAYYLLLEGYQVTIFEKLPKLGGMLRYGIPEYRLPKATLDEEIKWITDLGAKVKNNAEMGKDFTLDDLKKQGFDSVFLGAGAHKASKMRIEGEDTIKGIYTGIDFLREFEIHGNINLDGIVIVVGGGNTAIDAARTSLRCGASKVKIVYRRSIKEMPAHFAEVEAAQKEGVEILFLTNPKSIISENNKIKGIVCYKMRLEEVPGERPRPIEIKGSEFIIHCDYLISAIGQQVDNSFIVHENNCKLEKWGTICVNETTYETSIHGVFAAGDVVSGPLTAVNAIGQGKKAAIAINSYIKTGKAANKNGKFYSFKHKLTKISPNEYSHLEKIKRIKMPELPINERINNFKEVELGLNEVQAENETLRCLECGCSEYYDCELIKYANDYHIDISDYIGDVRKFKIDDSHPFIKLDPNKCINCGKCVRTCSEILKVSALGFINRGFKAVVKPAMEKPLIETNCISCGNCIDVCPTGAISEKYPFKVLGTLPKTNHISICNFCSLGCSLNFKIIDDDIIYVSNNTREILNTKNNGYLCIKGKFGHRYLTENLKLEFPSVKENGELKKTTQDEAISFMAKRLKEIIKKYGRDSIAVFGSPKWANEELYLLQKFARIALHTNNISSFTTFNQEYDLSSLDDLTGVTVSTISLNDIEKADIIVVINSALSEENLLIELKIKKAQKKGAKLILINSSEIKLTKFTDLWVDSKKATNTVLLNGIIKEVSDLEQAGLEKLKKMVAPFDNEMVTDITGIDTGTYKKLIEYLKDHTKNIVFIYHAGSLREKSK
ncbi:MAG: FAD-dependent oxidoreductase, partial [Bacteroidales bacterium]|nr:FAD-dependent oxidoreductase [Bacteroidales bacterium]